jgi:hypothetical protein
MGPTAASIPLKPDHNFLSNVAQQYLLDLPHATASRRSSWSGTNGEHFLQARGHFRQRIGAQPFASNPDAWNRMGADDRLAQGELNPFLAFAPAVASASSSSFASAMRVQMNSGG